MKNTPLALWLVGLVFAGCSHLPGAKPEPPPSPAHDIARTAPKRGEDTPTQVFDEATRRAAMEKRFPGSDTIELVRYLQWVDERAGACWSELSKPWEMEIDATYELAKGSRETAHGIEELKAQGWLGLYRTPSGSGFERRGTFRSLDLTVSTELACRCMVGSKPEVEEKKLPVRLRFRWQGKKTMPEASATLVRDGRAQGLKGAFAPGHLMTYEFPVKDVFPGDRGGRCGGSVAVTVLSDPAMQ
jgi:hypothetical protein